MNNLQDELAWLNHRLDNKLEEWRKLHRLHGRFNAFLMYCILVLITVSAYFLFELEKAECLDKYIIAASSAAVGALLAFSLLKWRLYHRLLTKGHKDKALIDCRHITSTPDNHLLKECQDNFINLLRVERSFPFSDHLKRLVRDAIGAFFGLPKEIAEIVKRIMRKIQRATGELLGWAKGNCAKIMKFDKFRVRSAIRDLSGYLKTCAKKLGNILFHIEQIRKSVRQLEEDIKKTRNDVTELEKDVEKLNQQVGQITPEKPKGQ
jgi:hypothetical protein